MKSGHVFQEIVSWHGYNNVYKHTTSISNSVTSSHFFTEKLFSSYNISICFKISYHPNDQIYVDDALVQYSPQQKFQTRHEEGREGRKKYPSRRNADRQFILLAHYRSLSTTYISFENIFSAFPSFLVLHPSTLTAPF